MDTSEVVPSQFRKTVYQVFAVLGLLLGATTVGYSTAVGLDNIPEWLIIVTAVFNFVSAQIGYVAQRNTPVTH